MKMRSKMFGRLGTRIALLIVVTGPIIFFVFMNLAYFGSKLFGDSWGQNALWVVLAIISTPLAMGFAAALYINRYFKRLIAAIEELANKSKSSAIPLSGIAEFDSVMTKFNGLQIRLNQEEGLRKNLIMDTSHEFNTPLTALTAQLAAMKDGLLPANKKRLDILLEHTTRLSRLVDGLDAYARARIPSNMPKQAIDLSALCRKIAEQSNHQWSESQMKLDLAAPAGYRLQAHPEAVERILTNLFQNSLRYSGASSIIVRANNTTFSVSDNGKGVDSSQLQQIFERFYRVDASRSRHTGGMGLGLAIVYELAQAQGWEVKAEDNHPGLKIIFFTR